MQAPRWFSAVSLAAIVIFASCQSQKKNETDPASELAQAGVTCKNGLYYYQLYLVKTRTAPPELGSTYKFNRLSECDNTGIVEKAKIKSQYPQVQSYCTQLCYENIPAILPEPDGPTTPDPQIQPIPPSQGNNTTSAYSRCVRNSWINTCTGDGGFIKCNSEAAAVKPSKVHLRLRSPIYKKCPEACRGAGNGYNDYGC